MSTPFSPGGDFKAGAPFDLSVFGQNFKISPETLEMMLNRPEVAATQAAQAGLNPPALASQGGPNPSALASMARPFLQGPQPPALINPGQPPGGRIDPTGILNMIVQALMTSGRRG